MHAHAHAHVHVICHMHMHMHMHMCMCMHMSQHACEREDCKIRRATSWNTRPRTTGERRKRHQRYTCGQQPSNHAPHPRPQRQPTPLSLVPRELLIHSSHARTSRGSRIRDYILPYWGLGAGTVGPPCRSCVLEQVKLRVVLRRGVTQMSIHSIQIH